MAKVAGTSHRIEHLELRDLSLSHAGTNENTNQYKVQAYMAFITAEGQTCGQVMMEGGLMSDRSAELLAGLVTSLELDMAEIIFGGMGSTADDIPAL